VSITHEQPARGRDCLKLHNALVADGRLPRPEPEPRGRRSRASRPAAQGASSPVLAIGCRPGLLWQSVPTCSLGSDQALRFEKMDVRFPSSFGLLSRKVGKEPGVKTGDLGDRPPFSIQHSDIAFSRSSEVLPLVIRQQWGSQGVP
jgi:hypothetical protein